MKKVFFCMALFGALASCKKEQASPVYSIYGKWELRHNTGGGLTPTPLGNTITYEFKADSTFVKYTNDALTASGQYHTLISNKTTSNTYGNIQFIGDSYADSFKLSTDTLTLGAGGANGGSHIYVKIH